MKHTPANITVYQTTDYDRFSMIKGNRELDMNKIKKILEDIARGTNLLKYCPCLVVEKAKKLDIIDGQHRYVVSKKTKEPVYYIMAEDLSLYDIARMNSNTEKWKAVDFINCYVQLGNNHYVNLDSILREYKGLSVTLAVSLLAQGKVRSAGSNGHRSIMEKFHRGEFKIEQYDKALHLLDKISGVQFAHRYQAPFMVAMEKVVNAGQYDVDLLVEKVNESGALQRETHWRKYLTAMEEIVSKGKQKRVAIY